MFGGVSRDSDGEAIACTDHVDARLRIGSAGVGGALPSSPIIGDGIGTEAQDRGRADLGKVAYLWSDACFVIKGGGGEESPVRPVSGTGGVEVDLAGGCCLTASQRPVSTATRLAEQAINHQARSRSDEHFAVGYGRYGELHIVPTPQTITSRVLAAIVEFVRQVGCIIGAQDCMRINRPHDACASRSPITGNSGTASWEGKTLR